MNATDKKAVEQAKAAQNGSAGKQKRTTRSTENAEQGLNNVQAKLNEARQKVRQSTKDFIFGGGISDALQDIANGDFGELGNEIFDTLDVFIDGIDSGRLALETRETEPKKMLAASLDCENCENSDN
ncbi:hypothetical protein QUA20_27680 [Microcoleus sp. Pol7_A1]|uniref:hypothetical protein n=1 Tax=Microcoleus sp. Pol7_A1 TaxID=2818893 RepID=UPI002FCF151F